MCHSWSDFCLRTKNVIQLLLSGTSIYLPEVAGICVEF